MSKQSLIEQGKSEMNSMLVKQLEVLQNCELRTLGRGESFLIVSVTNSAVTVVPSASGKPRIIPMVHCGAAFESLQSTGILTLKEIRRHCEMNPVYVAAMLAALPGIQYEKKPKILLRWPH